MRKLILLFVSVIIIGVGILYADDLKIGFLDIVEVFDNYQKTKDYKAILDKEKETKKKEKGLEEKQNKIKEMQKKLELLKEEEKEAQREKLRKAIMEYTKVEREIVDDLKKESDKKMQEILDDIKKVVSAYAKKKGLKLIIIKDAIFYSSEDSMDLTQEIISELNKKYSKK